MIKLKCRSRKSKKKKKCDKQKKYGIKGAIWTRRKKRKKNEQVNQKVEKKE